MLETAQPPATVTEKQALPRPHINRFSVLRDIFDLIIWIGIVYALVNLSSVRFVVQGPSMEPTFHDNQYLIISRVNYLVGAPQRGDVIVFHYPNNTAEDYIKRVIGLPGDVVEIREALVYVNDLLVNEPYINEPCTQSRCRDAVIILSDDEYYVMGDNRNRSRDSRDFGPINREHIIGKVLIRYWPPTDWGLIGLIDTVPN